MLNQLQLILGGEGVLGQEEVAEKQNGAPNQTFIQIGLNVLVAVLGRKLLLLGEISDFNEVWKEQVLNVIQLLRCYDLLAENMQNDDNFGLE